MQTRSIFEKLILLDIKSKNALDFLSCTNLNLENKILFYIYNNEGCSPTGIIDEFKIKKTNLATICKKLEDEKLISREKADIDRRSIKYKVAKKGEEKIAEMFLKIDQKFSSLTNDEKQRLLESATDIVEILSKFD